MTQQIEDLNVGMFANDNGLGPAIELRRGHQFHILHPEPNLIDVEDVAHSLSKLCRYTGHTSAFYSVAQHCVLVSDYLLEKYQDQELALMGLLHDATEAFIGDISRPLKRVMDQVAPGILRGIEDTVADAIWERFGLHPTEEQERLIKEGDNTLLATEKRDLMFARNDWANLPDPLDFTIRPMGPEVARTTYLDRYGALTYFPELAGREERT